MGGVGQDQGKAGLVLGPRQVRGDRLLRGCCNVGSKNGGDRRRPAGGLRHLQRARSGKGGESVQAAEVNGVDK